MSSHGLKRREFIGLLGAAAAWPTSARGQTRGKDPTIGVLWHAGDAEEEKFPLSLFRQGLHDVGYVEGQISQCTIAFLRNNPSVFTLLLMNSSGSMSTYCSQ
jgi:putative ABC transport system substrate-binding protein